MNNLIVSRLGGMDAVQTYASALQNMPSTLGTDRDGKLILRLDQETGKWNFGEEKVILEPEDLLAINPLSFRHGYIAFEGKAIAETEDGAPAELLLPLSRPLPREDDLPLLFSTKKSGRGRDDREARWLPQIAFDLIVVEGPNKGVALTYKQTSYGGLKMAGNLARDIGLRLGTGDEMCVAVVELFTSEYRTKDHNKLITNPEAAIIKWCHIDDTNFDGRAVELEAPRGQSKDAITSQRNERTAGASRGRGRPRLTDEEKQANADRRDTRGRDEEPREAVVDRRHTRGRDEEVDEAPQARNNSRSEDRPSSRRAAGVGDEEEPRTAPATSGRPARGRRA